MALSTIAACDLLPSAGRMHCIVRNFSHLSRKSNQKATSLCARDPIHLFDDLSRTVRFDANLFGWIDCQKSCRPDERQSIVQLMMLWPGCPDTIPSVWIRFIQNCRIEDHHWRRLVDPEHKTMQAIARLNVSGCNQRADSPPTGLDASCHPSVQLDRQACRR